MRCFVTMPLFTTLGPQELGISTRWHVNMLHIAAREPTKLFSSLKVLLVLQDLCVESRILRAWRSLFPTMAKDAFQPRLFLILSSCCSWAPTMSHVRHRTTTKRVKRTGQGDVR